MSVADTSAPDVHRSGNEIPAFIPLDDYEPPSGPVVHLAQRLLQRARQIVLRDGEGGVEDDRLKRASRATIDEHTAFPDCALLARELEASLGDWADGDGGAGVDSLRLVVVPPGDVNALLETWAVANGHAVLEAPARDALAEVVGGVRDAIDPPDLDGDGVLVVPRLERWFLRHRLGLRSVRTLLAALSVTERRCVVGCNSWAWSYLRVAAGSDLLLPDPLTFTPFDAARLAAWFGELAEDEGTRDVVFRESGSGIDVFALDGDGKRESDFLPGLAARSLGIPWVAWALWQRSLRTERVVKNGEDERSAVDDDVPEDESTLWLVEEDDLVLPGGHEHTASLVLQALLVHGALGARELALVLPIVGESNIVPALVRAGFVTRTDDDRFRCAASAYPAIVEQLGTAGCSMPAI